MIDNQAFPEDNEAIEISILVLRDLNLKCAFTHTHTHIQLP